VCPASAAHRRPRRADEGRSGLGSRCSSKGSCGQRNGCVGVRGHGLRRVARKLQVVGKSCASVDAHGWRGGDGNFRQGHVVVVALVREATTGPSTAMVIFHGGMLSSQWDPEGNQRTPRSGGHFWAGHVGVVLVVRERELSVHHDVTKTAHVAVVVVVREAASGFPAAVIFGGGMLSS
jgi:hypothetical protein